MGNVVQNYGLAMIFLMKIMLPNWVYGSPLVPCYFIFGASYYDNGNNNVLHTAAKANYLPYGIDFPGGATGRFTNGRTTGDFIAQYLGFGDYIEPFATARGQNILNGVDYASGGSGIRKETGKHTGEVVGMGGQLANHEATILKILGILGNQDLVNQHLNQCLYTVAMGDNDYINNYFLPLLYPTSRLYTPEQYASILLQQYSEQLKSLYTYGARKIALFNIPPLGCSPSASEKNYGKCVSDKNDAIQLFNNQLNAVVDDLNNYFPDAKFISINTYNISFPKYSCLKETKQPCCETLGSLCTPLLPPCRNRNDYLWWDGVHQTEASYQIIATKAYTSSCTLDAYPTNIHQLVTS